MKKILNNLHKDLYIEVFLALFIILSFCFTSPINVFKGYWTILSSPSILLTDYVFIAGMGPTFLNVAIMLLANLILIKVLDIKMSGPVYASLMIVVGFSFFGKNILNTLPIYFGIWLFSRLRKIPYKSLIITILLSTGLGPLVSYMIFGFGLEYYISIPLGILCGIVAGFGVPAFAAHTLSFHEGYNLYNTGFALGIIAAIFNGIFIAFNLKSQTLGYLTGFDDINHITFYLVLYGLAIFCLIIAFTKIKVVLKEYKALLKTSGRLISNYLRDFKEETVLFNFAILDIVVTTIFAIFGIPMNGIIFGSIISILGCSAFGLHIRNAISVWIGCTVAIICKLASEGNFVISFKDGLDIVFNLEVKDNLSAMVAFIFATGIAPICGKYGIIYGLVGGFIHILFTPLVLPLQGGYDLYNNGFSAGFEASILAVCAEKIFYRERHHHARKSKDM